MATGVFNHSVGMLLVRSLWLVRIRYNRLMIRYERSVRTYWLLRVVRRVMQMSDGGIWSSLLVTRFFSRHRQQKVLFVLAQEESSARGTLGRIWLLFESELWLIVCSCLTRWVVCTTCFMYRCWGSIRRIQNRRLMLSWWLFSRTWLWSVI